VRRQVVPLFLLFRNPMGVCGNIFQFGCSLVILVM
jgi:hypothetical protein